MRMARQLGRTIDAGEGDVGCGELLLQRIGVERAEYLGDPAVGFGAVFDALDIGGEGRIGRERGYRPRLFPPARAIRGRSGWK